MKILTLISLLSFTTPLFSQALTLDPVPSKLTHLFYTPTPYVNSANSLVLGLHEISYSLDGNLALQISLLESIGHMDFGAKYQLGSDLAVGAGLAGFIGSRHHHVGHIGWGSVHYHGPHKHRKALAVFLTGALTGGGGFTSAYTVHSQIGSDVAAGLDLGAIQQFSPMWSLILEASSSMIVNDFLLGLSGTAGIRITPPAVPYLFIDVGMTPLTVAMGRGNSGLGSAGLYLDISVAFDLD